MKLLWHWARKAGVFVLVFPAVLLLRLLDALFPLRFVGLLGHRIGHFAINTVVFLAERDAEGSRRGFDFFYCGREVSNRQLYRMFARVVPMLPGALASAIVWVDGKLPGGGKLFCRIPGDKDRDLGGYLDTGKFRLAFSSDEERRGAKYLASHGVKAGERFVCFHARDSAYLRKAFPGKDWSYHDHRDADVNSYASAVRALAAEGVPAFRMGSVVRDPLVFSCPGLVDYAGSRERSDFLDIYLSARCHFFIGTVTGLSLVPMIMNRPLVLVNVVPVQDIPFWKRDVISIPRKIWDVKRRKFVLFREVLGSEVGSYCLAEQYQKAGLEAVPHAPEEILAVVREMMERLDGTWFSSPEDEELQRRYWALTQIAVQGYAVRGRVGTAFLRSNRDLL